MSVQEKIKSLDSSFNDSPPPSRAGGLKKALSEDRKRVLSKGALSRQSSKAARFSKYQDRKSGFFCSIISI